MSNPNISISNPNTPVLYNSIQHGMGKKNHYVQMIGNFLFQNPTEDSNDKLLDWMKNIPHGYSDGGLFKIFSAARQFRNNLRENDPSSIPRRRSRRVQSRSAPRNQISSNSNTSSRSSSSQNETSTSSQNEPNSSLPIITLPTTTNTNTSLISNDTSNVGNGISSPINDTNSLKYKITNPFDKDPNSNKRPKKNLQGRNKAEGEKFLKHLRETRTVTYLHQVRTQKHLKIVTQMVTV